MNPETFMVLAFAGALALIALYYVITNLIYICGPNEVLVFSGKRGLGPDGKIRGYRIVKGGRSLRIPLLETVDRIDLTNMNIDVSVKSAFSAGGVPLNIDGIANVKIAGESPALDNALQRLLGKPKPIVARIAKVTLEGYLRGVLATLTPEQANEDTRGFERAMREQAVKGLAQLGLTLDNLKIQSINDDSGYLTAIGRVQAADLNRINRIAEAERRAESLVEQADARKRGELAKIQAQLEIARAESIRRVANAQTAQEAFVAEQQGEVTALLTRARAEVALQEARIEQNRRQLEADIVAPARADMEAKIAEARGDAAPILENGRAQAEALRKLAEQWRQAGPNAKDIFVLQKLESILPVFLESIRRVKVDNVTMLQGDGQGGGASGFATQAVSTLKALEAGGVDIQGLISSFSNKPSQGLQAPPKRS